MDDLISRQAAMAYPLSWEHYDKEHGNRHFICGVESYREYIESLPSAQQWIPCSERLPDQNGKYLVVGRQKAINILKFAVQRGGTGLMKREITVTIIVDTDDPLGLIRDDITQELNGCWHHMDSIVVTEEEAACRNCVKSVAMNDAGIMFKCTAKEYDYHGMACFVPKEYDINEEATE